MLPVTMPERVTVKTIGSLAASAPDDDEVAEAEIVDEPDEQQSA